MHLKSVEITLPHHNSKDSFLHVQARPHEELNVLMADAAKSGHFL